ncbi:MAG: DUF2946 domain-containing protein [Caulobacter sp.]|nr:DUF2946 domain-containing protein [Caulobacter sp.]
MALAVLSLLTQLLIPAASLAHETAPVERNATVVCTADGAVTLALPGDAGEHDGFGGFKCHDCVMASVASVQAFALTVDLPGYAVGLETARPGRDRPASRSPAPPRPPSTAPPALLNA